MLSLTSGNAVLITVPEIEVANFEVEVKFPSGSSTNKASFNVAHDGTNSYHTVVLNRNTGKIALYKVTRGSWGSVLASANVTVNDSTAYVIKVNVKQQHVGKRPRQPFLTDRLSWRVC